MPNEPVTENLGGEINEYKSEIFSLHKLRGHIIPFYKYWWIILPFMAASIGKEAYNVQQAPITYTSSAEMKVGSTVNIPDGNIVSEEYRNFYKTQTHIMESAQVRTRAVEKLNTLYSDLSTNNPVVSIHASQIEGTSIFILQAIGSERLYTQRFLNACIEEYLKLRKEEKQEVKEITYTQMEIQISQLASEIIKKEDELQEFQSHHDIVSIEEQSRSAANYLVKREGELAELENELDLIRLFEKSKKSSLSNLDFQYFNRRNQNGNNIRFRDSDFISTKKRLSALEAEKARFSQVLRPSHPKIKRIESEIDSLNIILGVYEKQGQDEINSRKQSIELQIISLKKSIHKWKDQSLDFSKKLAGFQKLNSRLNRLRELYAQKLSILDRIDLSRNIEQEMVSVIKKATISQASEPDLIKRLPKASMIGMFLGIVCIGIITLWKETIYTENNLPLGKDYSVAGYIPKISGKKLSLLKADDTRYSFIESFRSLRSYILLETQDSESEQDGLKIISVTSAIPSEGKSTVSSNLAISLSLAGYKTLLIDADMRKGRQHEEFNSACIPGLSEVLSATASIDDAIVPTKYEHLDLISRGDAIMTSSELILGSSCKQFFDIVSKHYRYVVVDTPPILATDDMANLIPHVDKILLVARLSLSTKKSVEQALNMLEARNGNIMGYILNSCESSTTNYYNYRYYGKYYASTTSK